MSQSDNTAKLWELIRSVEFAMLATEDGDQIRSRPMAVVGKEFDGNLWFFTRASAHKVLEVEQDQRVNAAFAHPGKQHYVSVSGRASLVRDKAQIQSHWAEAMRTWFPKGIDDPEIALLKLRVDQAEYWDAPSSTMVHLYGYVKAVVTGQSPHPGENAKISVG